MRQRKQMLPLLLAAVLCAAVDGRRVRVRPQPAEDDTDDQEVRSQRVQYYAAQPQDPNVETQSAGVVLVSSDAYNGLYGRPTVRGQTDASDQQYRSAIASSRALPVVRPRVKEAAKAPPVQTIRNYSKVNDDGSFTFGYEAADGSFKEETRGTDCVVRGKYGYVDPDGNKREFTYVSGNPCDPNAVNNEEEEKDAHADAGEENIPKGPLRPLRPRPTAASTVAPRPTTTLFQHGYSQDEEDIDNEPQQLFTPAPRTRYLQSTPSTTLYQAQSYEQEDARPVLRPHTAIRITPRPPTASSTIRSQLPATTYRPQLLQVSVTPRPAIHYSHQSSLNRPTPSPGVYSQSTQAIDFDEELRNFHIENNVLTTPSPVRSAPTRVQPEAAIPQQQGRKVPSSNAIYSSELVYDPASGQYNTVLYQALPQTTGEVNLRHRIQPYVHQQQQTPYQQQYYQRQQAALLAQSQQLYAAQQQQQQQQRYQQQQQATTPASAKGPQRYPQYQQPQQQYFYITPSAGTNPRDNLAHGQIDAFLRGHNIAF